MHRTSTSTATSAVSSPAPTSVCSAPAAAMIGPPASIPAELLALTTTLCPDSSVRRSAPADDRVMMTEMAAIPRTTVTPESAPITATTAGVVHRPMPTQHSPMQVQAIDANGTGLIRRTIASETAVPITDPTPYPVMPAAR